MTRRQILSLTALGLPARGQQYGGMASRGVAPVPRGKPSGLPFHANFVNVAGSAGLHATVIYGDEGHADYILDSIGCGAAFLDYDNDGWLDIVMLTGRRRTGPTPPRRPSACITTTATAVPGCDGEIRLGRSVWAAGIRWAITTTTASTTSSLCWGQNIHFTTRATARFRMSRRSRLLHAVRYGTGCTWVDYDRDGRLDLFVAHYLVFDRDKIQPRGKNAACNWRGVPVYCGPTGLPQERCRLYHNNGDGTFTDVSERAGILAPNAGYGLTAVATDFDGDGWPDIYVACDSSPSLLFRNNRNGTFTERGLESGVALNEDGKEQAGMGLGIGDFDNDGQLTFQNTLQRTRIFL
jgi:hypothetical protein